MTAFTVLELKEMMQNAADDASLKLDGDFLDTPFPDLDFDSLSVLELATSVQRAYGLALSDDTVAELTTPRAVLDYVTQQLGEGM